MANQILPVFAIIAVGFVLSLLKIADDSWVPVLNKYGLYIGFPTLIIANLIDIDRTMLQPQIPVFLTTVTIIITFMLITYACIRLFHIPKDIGTTLFLGSYNGNIGYLGFPLITAVMPEAGATIGLVIAAYSITTFTVGLFILESLSGEKKDVSEILHQVITSPFLIATGAGLLVVILNISLPSPLLKAIDMIEASASPVVLIGLGIFIQRKIRIAAIWRPVVVIFAAKMLIFPAIFILTDRLFDMGPFFDVAILEAGMPIAITNFTLSGRYSLNKELIVALIIITTVSTPILYPLLVAMIS